MPGNVFTTGVFAIDANGYRGQYSESNKRAIEIAMPITVQNPDVPTLVKALRSRFGMTQEQFAKEVGVTFSTINQWENGRRQPQPFLLKHLLDLQWRLTAQQKHARTTKPKRGSA